MTNRCITKIEHFLQELETNKEQDDFYDDTQYQNDMKLRFVHESNRIEGFEDDNLDRTKAILSGEIESSHIERYEHHVLHTGRACDMIMGLAKSRLDDLDGCDDAYTIFMISECDVMDSYAILTGDPPPNACVISNRTKLVALINDVNFFIGRQRTVPDLQTMVSVCAKWVIEFVRLRPFRQRNEGVARLWMSYLLLPYFPFIVNIDPELRVAFNKAVRHKSEHEVCCLLLESIERLVARARSMYLVGQRRNHSSTPYPVHPCFVTQGC
jgi:Fic family protein